MPTTSRTAASRCSQLSITSRPGRSPSTARHAARTSPCTTRRFSAAASACPMAAGSVIGASSSTATVSDRSATSTATRVFPTPPGPTTLTRRSAASIRCRAATSAARPSSRVADRGGGSGRAGAGPDAPPATSRSSSASAGDGSRPVSSASRRRYSRPTRSASGACPLAASARISASTAGSRSGSAATDAAASPSTSSDRPAAADAATSASVTSRCSRTQPSHGDRDRRDVGEVGEQRPPPERVRLPQRSDARRVRAGRREQRPRLRDVEVVGAEIQPVAVRAGLQPGGRRAELGPQPEHVRVQGLPRRLRSVRRARARRRGGRRSRCGPPRTPAARGSPGAWARGPRPARRRPRAAAGRAAPPAPALRPSSSTSGRQHARSSCQCGVSGRERRESPAPDASWVTGSGPARGKDRR